jgi:ankyrin repeat protein
MMRFLIMIPLGYVLLAGSTALAQTKPQDPDGFDEDSIKIMAHAYGDKRTIEQIRKDNALIRAAGRGDPYAVQKALRAGARINSYYIDGYAAFGSDGSGYTALMEATSAGHVEVVKLLIKEKADLNLKCINPHYDGETALYRAIITNKDAIVDLLVKAGAKGDPKQIRLGMEMRRAACRGFELKEGEGYPNYPGNAGGDEALEIAEVLKRGADINAPDPAGYTPLMYAVNLGLVENVKTLLALGADATLKTHASVTSTGGGTALSLGEADSSYARAERRQVVELLKAHLARASAQADKPHSKGIIDLEARLRKALGDSKREAIDELAREVGKLKEEDRRKLPFRVRPGSVEFRFRGECPGHTDSVEFVVSNKNGDYESLLVLSKTELERFEQLWKVIEHLARSGQLKNVATKKHYGLPLREPALEANLLHVAMGQARLENLNNILLKKVGGYLSWEEDGLRLEGDRNMDKALVPSTRQPAELLVVVRPTFLNP